MKRSIMLVLALASLVAVGVAAGSSKPPRVGASGLIGPVCAVKSGPLAKMGLGGVLRYVQVPQHCRAGEKRIYLNDLDKSGSGARGKRGAAGPAGPQGIPGTAAAKGDTGATGPAGPAGPQGIPGNAAAKGDKGDTGATGPTGAQGIQGIQGPKGDKGDSGGLGNQTIIACVSNGGTVQINVNGQPCGDNQGHTQIELVAVSVSDTGSGN